jgi:hypothetical protein
MPFIETVYENVAEYISIGWGPVASSCEGSNTICGSIDVEEFRDQLTEH